MFSIMSYIGKPDKVVREVSLRRWHFIEACMQKESRKMKNPGKDHSRQREQQIQRLWGARMLDVCEEKRGQCSHAVSRGRSPALPSKKEMAAAPAGWASVRWEGTGGLRAGERCKDGRRQNRHTTTAHGSMQKPEGARMGDRVFKWQQS